jgi:hypothetical protein
MASLHGKGSSYYIHSNNVLGHAGNGIQFNGGTQIWTYSNLLVNCGWHLGPTPDVARSFNNTVVDNNQNLFGACKGFWNTTKKGAGHGIYTGDYSFAIRNSTGTLSEPVDWSKFYCGYSLAEWQTNTNGQDMHSTHVVANGDGTYDSPAILAKAKTMMWEGQLQL